MITLSMVLPLLVSFTVTFVTAFAQSAVGILAQSAGNALGVLFGSIFAIPLQFFSQIFP
jgi:hypothetical protein